MIFFDSVEAADRRRARPRWLKILIAIGWGLWVAGFALSGAGTFFLLCYMAAEIIKGR